MNLINAFSRKKLHKDYNIDNINMFQGTLEVFDMPNWYIEHPQGSPTFLEHFFPNVEFFKN